MAETVHLNNGTIEIVIGDTDEFLENLIRKNISDDAARLYRNRMCEINGELEWVQKTGEECERINDHYYRLCTDARDNFKKLIDLLQEPRLNRSKIQKAVNLGYNDLQNNL